MEEVNYSEKLSLLQELTKKEIDLSFLTEELKLNEYEIFYLVKKLRDNGVNIVVKNYDDDIYMLNQGEIEEKKDNYYSFNTGEDNTFKFVAISDTRFGSKSQQLSILNDIYMKADDLGYNNVIHCGNISSGLYSISDVYADTNFLDDTLKQADYISKVYPHVDGINTYFISGIKDEKHLKNNKINICKRISEARNDLIFLGNNSCNIMIDKVKMLVFNNKLGKTYTVSYRPQQQIDSFRSEDKPDILLYGGLLQMEKFNYRNVNCISVPSVCATTREMSDKRYSNTVGAWYITVEVDNKGNLSRLKAIDSVYYVTQKDDYRKAKILKLEKDGK